LPALCTPITHFPPIGNAAYHQRAGKRPSHGHRKHAQKIGKDYACGSRDILADKQTDRQADILITILHSHGRSKYHVSLFTDFVLFFRDVSNATLPVNTKPKCHGQAKKIVFEAKA